MMPYHHTILATALIWFSLFIHGCSEIEVPAAQNATQPKDQTMTIQSQMRLSSTTIPPIDAAAPEAYQTATFGLG